jgi:hypothetical protein
MTLIAHAIVHQRTMFHSRFLTLVKRIRNSISIPALVTYPKKIDTSPTVRLHTSFAHMLGVYVGHVIVDSTLEAGVFLYADFTVVNRALC